MRILFVDDDSNKIKKLYKIANRISGLDKNEIEHELDLKSAEYKMRKNCYDLLILDLNISEQMGEDNCDEIAGLNFVDDIIEIDAIKIPREIIILTAYEELKSKCINTKRHSEIQILKYDETSNEWEGIIESKLQYLSLYKQSFNKFVEQTNFEVAIITAVQREMSGVFEVFSDKNIELITFDQDPTNYYKIEESENKIIMAQQSEMGMAAAATLTSKIIYHFNPRYIIMIGIAAGIGNEKNFGDILIPTSVWDYSSGKCIVSSNECMEIEFQPDPKFVSLDPLLERELSIDYSDVLFQIKKKWRGTIDWDLKIVTGAMACGTAVVANRKIVDDLIKEHSRKTIGLDMESYGMFYAVKNAVSSRVKAICMKSICDFADEGKSDDYQEYAAYTSAAFARYFIENKLLT